MELSRRGFLRGMLALAATELALEVIPLNRVWSFPSKIIIARDPFDEINAATLNYIRNSGMIDNFFKDTPLFTKLRSNSETLIYDGGVRLA